MKILCVSTLVIAGLSGACADQGPDSSGKGPIERAGTAAGKAVDQTVQATVLETGNAILHSKVRLALLDALGTDALRMEIDVNDGNVSLAGKVREPASRDRAGEVARNVGGVKEVKTDLSLVMQGSDDVAPADKLSKEVADQKIEAKVRLKLLDEVGAAALKVNVKAADGTVTLSGNLDQRDLRDQAEAAAKATDGVSRVINNIETKTK
jgi:hyperosmotically inducible periplasmic protein